ncbi:MAG: FecR domain-containing protein [Rhodospirillales bacterium]
MNTEDKGQDPILDRAISEIRNEPVDPAEISAAADRVWNRISSAAPAHSHEDIETIRTCADYQALLPAFREGALSSARAMLVEDHLHECVVCRKAMAPRPPVEAVPLRWPAVPVWKWAVAAAMALAVGLSGYLAYDRFAPAPAGPRATVYAVDGTLYKVAGGFSAPLAAAATIEEGESIRTAKGSGAVIRLLDGSLVEMRERTEFSVAAGRRDITIDLAGGSVIVQAAKQRKGHLYVSTADCRVAVTGTVFSVNRGVKGSRVSVIEGEVRVEQGNRTTVLHPGDQVATAAALAPVPLEQEIAWSRNFEQHIALLNEFAKIRRKLEAMPGPALRYSSRLLELVPDGAVFFAAIPNLGPTLAETNRIFQEQMQQSEALRQWWAEKMGTPEQQAKFDEMLSRIRAASDYLGQEIVFTLFTDAAGRNERPLFLAEVTRSGFREFLQQEIARVAEQSGGKAHVRIVDDFAAAPVDRHELLIWVGNNVVAASSDPALLRSVASGSGSMAPESEFKKRIAAAYADGVSWLLCADMRALIGKSGAGNEGMERSGFGDVRYLIAQRKDVRGWAENSAVLSFAQPRRSIASWLAAPAPMRVLDYISPDATLAVAAVAKNPARMLEDVAAVSGQKFLSGLSEFEANTGVNFASDLVEPLGGEIAFAIDGPMLPVPSWKLVLEVNNPNRFVAALGKLVAAANSRAGTNMEPLRLDQQPAAGRVFYTLAGGKPGLKAHFVFEKGLLIAAPSRDLLVRALEYSATGYSLPRSQKFTALLPHDGQTNFSGMVYHDVGALVSPLAGAVQLTPEQRKSVAVLAPDKEPTLIVVYGEEDRIQLASRGSFFGFRPEQLLGLTYQGPHGAHRKPRQ